MRRALWRPLTPPAQLPLLAPLPPRLPSQTIPLAQSASHLSHANEGLTQRAECAEKRLAQEATRRHDAETKFGKAATQPTLKRSASSQSAGGRGAYSQSPYPGRSSPASPKKRELLSVLDSGRRLRSVGRFRSVVTTDDATLHRLTCDSGIGFEGGAAKLKPGNSGYAGSSYRIGKMADDPNGGFDEDPPSE